MILLSGFGGRGSADTYTSYITKLFQRRGNSSYIAYSTFYSDILAVFIVITFIFFSSPCTLMCLTN